MFRFNVVALAAACVETAALRVSPGGGGIALTPATVERAESSGCLVVATRLSHSVGSAREGLDGAAIRRWSQERSVTIRIAGNEWYGQGLAS